MEPNPNLLRNFFQLRFGHFPRKGGGADPNPNFLRNFYLHEMRSKKVPQTCPNLQRGRGVKAVQQKSKVKMLFFRRGFPKYIISS